MSSQPQTNQRTIPEHYLLPDPTPIEYKQLTTKFPKLKPGFVKSRISKLKTYEGAKKNIRGSPWKLNLVCQFAAGQTVEDALTQLTFCEKGKAPLVQSVIQRTANLADIRDGLRKSQLEVAECFATHGTHLKRIKYMAKGRAGKKLRRFAHMRVVLREIDFNLKIAQAPSVNAKKQWILRKRVARQEAEEARKEKDEMEALEKAAAEKVKEEEDKEKKK